MSLPTPEQLLLLGRGVLVDGDGAVPPAWAGAPVVEVRDLTAVPALHDAWLRRQPIVVRVFMDPATVREPMSYPIEPWKVDPSFDAADDRLHFLLWANNYDARSGEPVWWWTRKAERIGAVSTPDGPTDAEVDGRAVWIDGGPRQQLTVAHIHRESVDLGRLRVCAPPRRAEPGMSLADDQLAAVNHIVGPARIIAPAGSGKTRVLSERLRHLLSERRFERDTVVAVAYNKKAQEELASRSTEFRPRVSTLNSLGWELLGRPPVIEEREVRRIIERLVPAQRRRANVDPIGPYIDALGRIRLGLLDPALVEEEHDDVPGLADAFDPYRRELKTRAVVDFDEQIYSAIERLLDDGPFRRTAQQRFRHLLVDEFQDLTPAHLLMVRLLATPELDVFGVGDDDQVIYGHAGADPRFLVEFDRYFPGAASHPLTVNYRCPVKVVNAAKTLLAYNSVRVAKEITAAPDAYPSPRALTVHVHASEVGAKTLVEVVEGALRDGFEPADIAVLTRVNSLLLAPHVALMAARVPVESTLEANVLDRTGARAALAYLRIATAGSSGFASADVLEIIRRPSRGLPIWIEKWFRSPTIRVRDIRAIGDRLDDAKVSSKVDSLADDLDSLLGAAAAPRATTRTLLRFIKDRIGLGQAMSMLDQSASASHLDDLEALEQVADLHPDPGGFEPWLRAKLTRPIPSDEPERAVGVSLATVHRVKGREWPVVVLFGVNDGLVPHRLSDDDEEERRVLHVGITRGHRYVHVLTDSTKQSPFIAEMDGTAPRRAPTTKRVGVTTPTTS